MESRGFVSLPSNPDPRDIFSAVYIASLLSHLLRDFGDRGRAAKLGDALASKAVEKGTVSDACNIDCHCHQRAVALPFEMARKPAAAAAYLEADGSAEEGLSADLDDARAHAHLLRAHDPAAFTGGDPARGAPPSNAAPPSGPPLFIREDVYVGIPPPIGIDVGLKFRRDSENEPLYLELKYNALGGAGSPRGGMLDLASVPPVFEKVSIPAQRLAKVGGEVQFVDVVGWAHGQLAAAGHTTLAAGLHDLLKQPVSDLHHHNDDDGDASHKHHHHHGRRTPPALQVGAGLVLTGCPVPLVYVAKARTRKRDVKVVKQALDRYTVEFTFVRTQTTGPWGDSSEPRFWATACIEGEASATLQTINSAWNGLSPTNLPKVANSSSSAGNNSSGEHVAPVLVGGYPALVVDELRRFDRERAPAEG